MASIQTADLSHVKIIREIAETTWWQAYSGILSQNQIRYMLDSMYAENTIEEQLEQSSQAYLLVYEQDIALGFASFAPRKENPHIIKLHKLYCLPEVQQKGYGRMLIQEVEKRGMAAGKQWLELNVNRENPAIKFYKRLGFSVAYQEDVPIGEFWMNDYVMRKPIGVPGK